MNYTSTLATILHNPNHPDLARTHYNSNQFIYLLKDNTLYYLTGVWCGDFRLWLEDNGIEVPDNRRLYTPIAKLEQGELIGYNTQYANIGNKFLDMHEPTRDRVYYNLYFVEIGNHPYPKQARYNHNWIQEMYHRECHRILNPPTNPKDFFVHPSQFGLSAYEVVP